MIPSHLATLRAVLGDPVTHSPTNAYAADMRVSDEVILRTYGSRYLAAWRTVQAAGEEAYAKGPVGNFSVAAWKPAIECGQLLRESIGDGRLVLDVGCGLLPLPAYMPAAGPQRFVGVDPMMGTEAREFPFVQAYGDFLPFRANAFDSVQFISSLDHMLQPARALREAFTVMKPGGTLLVEETTRVQDRDYWRWWLRSLRGPARFNTFHNFAFTAQSLSSAIRRAGFRDLRIVPMSEAREVCVIASKPS